MCSPPVFSVAVKTYVRDGKLRGVGIVSRNGAEILQTDEETGANATHVELRVQQRIVDHLYASYRPALEALIRTLCIPRRLLPREYQEEMALSS